MTLKLYRQKRNFKKTPEPKGSSSARKKIKNLYIVQKHAASHLHYDFRLELNGVLISWAIPKGPSLDPSVKRLAMHVEDHPLEYGSFEGIIPKGQYGGGTVMLWDEGQWFCEVENPTEAYKKGDLTFELKAKKLNGRWKLIRINKNDKTWLLMKLKDKYARSTKTFDITEAEPNSVITQQSIDEISENYKKVWGKKELVKIDLPKKPFPDFIYPQLATLVDKPPEGKNWLYEIKFDGYRLIILKQGKAVRIFTRNHNDWTHKFKNLAKEISKLPIKNLVLDGEVVVLDENQHSNFQLLQNALKDNAAEFIYYIFDLPYYDQFDLTSLKLIERKAILQQLLSNYEGALLHYSDHIFGSGKEILKKTCVLGLEGIIAKKANNPYSQIRNKDWLKIKCIQRQEFVIGGFNKSKRRKFFRSLMLGTFNKHNQLIYHGNVGTGFTESSLETIHTLLSKNITDTMPFSKRPPGSKEAVWINPVIVAEVEFTEWTNDGTLRHPSFKGIRSDKPAKSIIKEKPQKIEEINRPYKLSNPGKILYPESKITKADVAEYYHSIHEWILPYISNRPLTLVRCPKDYTKCFFQKHIHAKAPPGVHEITIKEKNAEDEYIYINDSEGLLSLVQLGVLEMHPWGSHIKKLEYPDVIIFDLDPAPKLPWKKVVTAAFEIKSILEELKLKSFVKTTGGKGLHVVTPIKPEYGWDEIKNFSKILVDYLVLNNPKDYISKMTKIERTNKIFVDYLRNQRGATAIAPYSTRARKYAPVATPIAWDELTNDIRDTLFTIETLPKRLQALKNDPWKEFFKTQQSLKNINKIK